MISDKKERKQEMEASLFAAYLLVPERNLIEEMGFIENFNPVNDKHLKILANKFQVPLHIISFRITQVQTKQYKETK